MSADPLADVIAGAFLRKATEERPYVERAADAVRAHLAAVLDAEAAKWEDEFASDSGNWDIGQRAMARVRSALAVPAGEPVFCQGGCGEGGLPLTDGICRACLEDAEEVQ